MHQIQMFLEREIAIWTKSEIQAKIKQMNIHHQASLASVKGSLSGRWSGCFNESTWKELLGIIISIINNVLWRTLRGSFCVYACSTGCLTGWWKWSPNLLKLLEQMRQPRPLLLYGNTLTQTHIFSHTVCLTLLTFHFSLCLSDITGPPQTQSWWGSFSTSFMIFVLQLQMCVYT